MAGAQTARTDTAPARPVQPIAADADAQLPGFVPADSLSDAESARRLALFYDRQAALLQAEADGDPARFAILLDNLVADVQMASQRSGAMSEPRFRALYSSVLTEYERYYDRPAVDRGDVYAFREAGISAIERGFDAGAPLLEHVTLPDVATFETVFPMDVNPKVERYLQFLMNRPSHVQRLRTRADTYFPMIERVLAEEGVPDELKYLAMVESALVPVAESHMAAAGLWQFIRATGRAYGLRAESDIDDRLDPEASTRAAARHLRDLYDRFGDWQLALAGYNCNPAVIARAVRRFEDRTGQRATFWDIDSAIPRETRAYVPMFIATSLVVSNPDAYGFPAHEPGPAYVFDRIPVEGGTTLATVSRIIDVDVEVLRALNPSLRRNRVPDIRGAHMLRIPVGSHDEHADALGRLAPPEARGEQYAAQTVSFGPRAVRPIAPQEHGEAIASLTARRMTARANQPRRVHRDEAIPMYAAQTPAEVADAEARYAIAVQADRAREAREAAARPQVLLATRTVEPEADETPKATPPASVGSATEAIAEVTPGAEPIARTMPDAPVAASPAEEAPAPAVRAVQPDVAVAVQEPAADRGSVADTASERQTAADASASRTRAASARRVAEPVAVQVVEPTPEADEPEVSEAPPVRVVSTAPEQISIHRVQRGEYLMRIARQYGLSLNEIRALNPGIGDELAVGQRIRVSGTPTEVASAPAARPATPSRPSTHTVRRGEHLTGIARQYGVSISDLREWNGLASDVIHVGQRLRLRARGSRG